MLQKLPQEAELGRLGAPAEVRRDALQNPEVKPFPQAVSVSAVYWQNLTFRHLAKEKKCKEPGFVFIEKANMINLDLTVNKLITGTESLV